MRWNRGWAQPGTGAAACAAEGASSRGPLLPSPLRLWPPWSCSVEEKTVSCSCRPAPSRFLPQPPPCRRSFSSRPPPHCRRIRCGVLGVMPGQNRFNIRSQCFRLPSLRTQPPSRNSRKAIPDRSPERKSRKSLFRGRRTWPFRRSSTPVTMMMKVAESGSASV